MEVNELVSLIQQGDTSRMEELWLAVEKFVRFYAAKYVVLWNLRVEDLDDLYQSGYFALLKSVELWEPDKGSFLTYLACSLRTAFADAAKGRSCRRRNDPLNYAASLDAPLDSDDPDGSTLADIVQDPRDQIAEAEDRIYNEELHAALETALSGLPERQRAVLRALYFQNLTFKQSAAVMGVSTGVIGQLQRDGLIRIRQSAAKRKLERFLDNETNFYQHVSVDKFNQTHESAVEKIVLRRDRLSKTACI